MEQSFYIKRNASKSVAWLAYIVIIFEMLYMSTPFAVFFYSVYQAPLKVLNNSSATSWLVQNVLPHFTQTESLLINTLLYMSWPLMGFGMLIFIAGFIQVYWAKFRKRGAVTGGLYRFIRHPQYTGWAIFGLGMSLFWSRMIVLIAYVSMLFVYYILARSEERECLDRYGKDYEDYMKKTGRFLPKFRMTRNESSTAITSNIGLKRRTILALSYLFTLICVVMVGFGLRAYSLSEISHTTQKNAAIISLSPMKEDRMERIVSIANMYIDSSNELKRLIDPSNAKFLIYILPLEWHVPELAMERENPSSGDHGANPTSHGNPSDFDPNLYKLLYSRSDVDPKTPVQDIISEASRQEPVLIIKVDLKKQKEIMVDRPPQQGKYADIPVPIF